MSHIMWNPWHGCKRVSEGCKNCYVYYIDSRRDVDASQIRQSRSAFELPLKKDRRGEYKIPDGSEVGVCFTSDFFLEEADAWRERAWECIAARSRVNFLIPTKRIARILQCLPKDWGAGWENVTVAVSVENNRAAAERLPHLSKAPLKHKAIFAAPLLEDVSLAPYLKTGGIDYVSVGGESYAGARECRFEWVKNIKEQCDSCGIPFDFHQTGSNFVKDGRRYRIPHRLEFAQARKAFCKQSADAEENTSTQTEK